VHDEKAYIVNKLQKALVLKERHTVK